MAKLAFDRGVQAEILADPDLFERWLASTRTSRLFKLALSLAIVRDLKPFPAWRFGIEEDRPVDRLLPFRLDVWHEFRRRQVESPMLLPWHWGLRLPIWLGNDTSRGLFVGTCIEPNELFYVNSIVKSGMVVLDGGANEGMYSYLASRLVGDSGLVLAVEPSPRELKRLSVGIKSNRLRNVTSLPIALSDTDGSARLNIAESEHSGQNTFGSFGYEGIAAIATETVDTTTIDTIAEDQALERLDFVKLDIEGSELKALRGATTTLQRFRPHLLFEFSHHLVRSEPGAAESLVDLLYNLSYSIHTFDDQSGLLSEWKIGQPHSNNLVAVPQ